MNKCAQKFVLATGVIFIVCIVFAVSRAQASLIGPFPGPSGDKNYDVEYFSNLAGDDIDIIELDKDEFDDGFPPIDLESYLHVTIDPDDPKKATVSWDLTDTGLEAWYVAVKDGNTPSGEGVYWVWYQVSATNTDNQRIIGVGSVDTYLNGAGNISNITLYGTSVPDASVMLLLGSSLMGLAVFSRKSKRS